MTIITICKTLKDNKIENTFFLHTNADVSHIQVASQQTLPDLDSLDCPEKTRCSMC